MKNLYRLHVSCITSNEIRENADGLDNYLSNAEGTKARQIVESSEQPAEAQIAFRGDPGAVCSRSH